MRRILLSVLLGLAACGRSDTRDSDLVLLHVTDPRLVASAPDPVAATNRQAFAAAVQRFQTRPGHPSPPTLLVVSGALAAAPPIQVSGDTTPTAASTSTGANRPPAPTQPGTAMQPGTGTPTTTGTPTATGTQPDSVTVDTQAVGAQVQNPGAQTVGQIGAPAQPTAAPATPTSAPPRTAAEADSLARVFAAVPVSDIFLVAASDDASLADSLRARPLPNGTRVHDLTACQRLGMPRLACSADVAGTPYRFVGFTPDTSDAVTLRRLARLDSLVELSVALRRSVIIVAAAAPPRVSAPAATDSAPAAADTSAARRARSITALWDRIVSRAQAVLGGETMELGQTSPKLVRTPPLGSDQPLASLSATRSAAYLRLGAGGPDQRILRYQAAFSGDPAPVAAVNPRRLGWIGGSARWLWNMAPDAGELARAVILAIAFIAAYLTIAALWRLQDGGPAITLRQTTTASGTTTTASASATADAPATTAAALPTPTLAFDNNFSRTILSGLAGLVLLTFIKGAWSSIFPQAETYYVIWFVALFLALLVSYALLRGLTEVLRSRLATSPRAPVWSRPPGGTWKIVGSFLLHWFGRFLRWLLSLRGALLVFLDTVLAIVLGRNQLRSAVWEDTIVNLQWSLYATLERERQDIERALHAALNTPAAQQALKTRDAAAHQDLFRVGISLMSPDESAVTYVAMSRGSLARRFSRDSIAWVATKTGMVRWWKKGQEDDEERILYAGLLDGQQVELKLKAYFEPRTRSSYEAFVVIPLPQDRRDMGAGHRKGAIHISLRYRELFDVLWPLVEPDSPPATRAQGNPPPVDIVPVNGPPAPVESAPPGAPAPVAPARPYAHWEQIYRTPGCLGPLLENAAGVVGIVLQQFNEDIFMQYIRPYHRDAGA